MIFTDYLHSCRTGIQQRPDYVSGDETLKKRILEANSPFEWAPQTTTRKAVLLIHGLFDSPGSMHSLGHFFASQGYWVRGLLLPGHGTRPEDLLQIRTEQWISACQSALAQLPPSIDQLVLCGFSTGGLLNHYLSLTQDIPPLKAIVSLAPALALRAPSWLLNNQPLCTLLKKILPWHHKTHRYDYARYNKHAFNAGCEVQHLIRMSQALTRQSVPSLPAFYVLTLDDEVIDSRSVQDFFKQHCTHPQSRCLMYGAATHEKDPRFINRPSRYPAQHIDSFSHIALPIATHHPHYGEQGDYTHESYRLLKPGQKALLGKLGSDATIRLSYNPDFEYLCDRLKAFLDKVV